MRTEVRNQIEMLRNAVAAELPRRRETHRRWLCIGPSGTAGIGLREVEVPTDVDPTDWPMTMQVDPVTVAHETFPSLDAALAALVERGIDTDQFDAIWKSDNPF